MRKKLQRSKQLKNWPIHLQSVDSRISQVRSQMHQGNFAETITMCQKLLSSLPLKPPQRVELLAFLGLSQAMLKHYKDSYETFKEALTIDPDNAELWYNYGLACHFTTRIGQSVRAFERALELLKRMGTAPDDWVEKFTKELKASRELAQEEMQARGEHFTLDQLIEQEEHFQRGLRMMKSNKWEEAEQAFRQAIEMGDCMPQHWGNLAVSLVMQHRYDESEAALRRALDIDPQYQLARDNLALLPEIRRTGRPRGFEIRNAMEESTAPQAATFYQHGSKGRPDTRITVKQADVTQRGQHPSRYRFFLNPYINERFTICPECGYMTRLRKIPLMIQINPQQSTVVDKNCRYCFFCDLLIVHQHEIEEQLAAIYSKEESRDYKVLGTIERAEWKRNMSRWQTPQDMLEGLHNFKEVMTFKRAKA